MIATNSSARRFMSAMPATGAWISPNGRPIFSRGAEPVTLRRGVGADDCQVFLHLGGERVEDVDAAAGQVDRLVRQRAAERRGVAMKVRRLLGRETVSDEGVDVGGDVVAEV